MRLRAVQHLQVHFDLPAPSSIFLAPLFLTCLSIPSILPLAVSAAFPVRAVLMPPFQNGGDISRNL